MDTSSIKIRYTICANRTTVSALLLIFIFGLNSMYGLVYRNGYYDALIHIRDYGPHVLPGSQNLILTRFTLIRPLDKLLTLAGVMFASITDGATPQLSLYAFHFAGQLVPVFTVMMIEGKRRGNQGSVLSLSVLWACAVQALGYGFMMPIYAMVHLSSVTASKSKSALAKGVRTRDIEFIAALKPSLIIGYIFPSILMAIPIRSSALHQWLGGFWQGFPVWVNLLKYCQPTNTITSLPRVGMSILAQWQKSDKYTLGYLHKKVGCDTSNDAHSLNSDRSSLSDRIEEMRILHGAYLFAFTVAASTHIATFVLIALRRSFPVLFAQLNLATLNFVDVFVPPVFYSHAKMKSMAIGIHNFFQYDQYVGSTAALTWAMALYCHSENKAMTPRRRVWLVFEIIGLCLIAGPGGALASLMWKRDEGVIGDDSLYESRDN